MSRLFVLNRYLFDLPPKARIDRGKVYGLGFCRWVEGNEIPLLWPFSRTDDGTSLSLTGRFRGYMGHEYLAVPAFDYYNRQYGRRQGTLEERGPSPR
jgi:hypothetical protein